MTKQTRLHTALELIKQNWDAEMSLDEMTDLTCKALLQVDLLCHLNETTPTTVFEDNDDECE